MSHGTSVNVLGLWTGLARYPGRSHVAPRGKGKFMLKTWKQRLGLMHRAPESAWVFGREEAAQFDGLVAGRWFWFLNRSFLRQMSRLAPPQARVLDIGTGPGWIPIELARRHPGWELCAIDTSE